MLKLVKKPGLAVEAKVSLLRPLQTMLHWVVASVVLHHLPLAAQEVDTSPVQKVDIRVKGKERIISPIGQSWDSFFLDGPTVSDDFLPERATQHQPEREAL